MIKVHAARLAAGGLLLGAGPARANHRCEPILLGASPFERVVQTFKTPEYFAARAVPSLFAPLPPSTDFNADALPPELDSIQIALDRAQIAARPARATTLAALDAKTIWPRLIVSTHLLPDLQAPAARWIADSFATPPPVVALVSSIIDFGVYDAGFANIVDAFLVSAAGESRARPRANVTYLIGGYADACLANSLRLLARAAAQSGLASIEVHLPIDLIYARTHVTLRAVRDDLSPAEVARVLESFYASFRVDTDSIRRADGRLRLRLVDWHAQAGPFDAAWRLADVDLILE